MFRSIKRLISKTSPRFLAAAAVAVVALPALAHAKNTNLVQINAQTPGVTPFINILSIEMANPAFLESYTFTVLPKTGSQTRPISARYSGTYLQGRGFIDTSSTTFTVPVWGLYQDYLNTVSLTFQFVDGHTEQYDLQIQTARYKNDVYIHPKVRQPRTPDTTLSYDFMFLKNYAYGPSPTILDTDGEIRWIGVANVDNLPSTLYGNSVYTTSTTALYREEFDGAVTLAQDYSGDGVVNFFHNLDFGRDGILTDIDTAAHFESTVMEVSSTDGTILRTWSLSDIVSNAMTAGGDDPSGFVLPPPKDWFHCNCAVYRPSDNTLVVSSRENFVIALDYDTQAIKWIFGDETKQWYQYPSLRAFAVQAGHKTQVPIGQHALSFVDDNLLLFDDGEGSLFHTPPGITRTYSAPRKYRLNKDNTVATEIWTYADHQKLFSMFCSSVYEDQPDNYLIDYTLAAGDYFTELVGLDDTGAKVFEYDYPANDTCATAWNALPIHLENMNFD